MFLTAPMLIPGQELKDFEIYRSAKRETERGRTLNGAKEHIGSARGIVARTRPDERERWRQLQHPITHKIILRGGADLDIRPGDVFEGGGRRFGVQTLPDDPGVLGLWRIVLCEERADGE